MIHSATVAESARQAEQLLQTLRQGGPSLLAPELERMTGLPAFSPGMPSAEVERWELLQSIAEQMQHSAVDDHAQDVDVCIRLLEHLASPAVPLLPA